MIAAEPLQGELVQGLRSLEDGYIPPIIDLELLDRKIFVSNRDAVVWTKKLLEEEGLFVGVSCGAIAAIAIRVAGELDEGNVVFVVSDDGWKYLSSGVYSRSVDELEADGTLESGLLLVIRWLLFGLREARREGIDVGDVVVVVSSSKLVVLIGVLVQLLAAAGGALERVAHLAEALAQRARRLGKLRGPSTISAITAITAISMGDGPKPMVVRLAG